MDWWIQRDGRQLWLYREAPGGGYRVARFEDDEESRYFAEWFVLRLVPGGKSYQEVLPADWASGTARVPLQPQQLRML